MSVQGKRQHTRRRRLYALFERIDHPSGKVEWKRISIAAYPLDQARRYFQSQLLAPYLADCWPDGKRPNVRELRPVREWGSGL